MDTLCFWYSCLLPFPGCFWNAKMNNRDRELTVEEMIHCFHNPVGKRSLAELDDVIDEIIDRNPDFVEKINEIVNRHTK
jgi:hypothetical protein